MTYHPADSVSWARPVQVETVHELSGCDTPTGKGILAWRSGSLIRTAVLSSVVEFGVDNSVAALDIRTALDFSADHEAGPAAVFRLGDELFLTTSRVTAAGSARTELWVADDVEDPITWSLRGEIQVTTTGIAGRLTDLASGTVFVMDSGRWVYQGGSWSDFFGNYFHRSGAFHSDDQGATWAQDVNQGYYIVGGSYLIFHSKAVGFDPISGLLFWFGTGSVEGGGLWTSPDGATWTIHTGDAAAFPIGNDGDFAYVADTLGVIYRMDDLSFAGMTPVASWLTPGAIIPPGTSMMDRAFVDFVGRAFFFYGDDRVAVAPARGWQMGSVAL